MPRNITVTFDDGSSHVYNNAPDDVTPEQIEARASRDFAGKRVTALDGGRGRSAEPPAERQRVPDIPGTPEGYADRVAMIPGATPGTVAPPAQRAAPVPQEERGLFARIRAGLEAARYTVASIVPGAVGYGVGVLEGITRAATNTPPKDWKPGENLAERRAQQFVDATVTKPPSALGQEYAQDVGEFARRHGASVAAGPLGLVGQGRHTRAVGDVRTGLRAALGTPGDAPPGLPPVAPSAEKPAGGLAKRVVQPNPALLADVKAAEKAGLTVLPHHVAEGDAVRALGTAAGGAAYKQNTKAFTKALIKELDPEEKSVRLDTKTFHRVLDKQGKTIGENMAKYDMPVDDALRARLEAISKDAADNADADTGRMTMNRVREILGKAEAGEGQIAGQAVRELDTAIGRQIRSNTKNQDLVARLRAVQDVLRDAAERQMAPDEAKAVQQARRRYAYAMEILPDIDDFGRTGYYEPGQLWKRLTSSEAGRQRVANERGGLTDLAKAGALVADRSGTGHGYVSVGSNSVGIGASGMRAYASPNMMLKLVTGGAVGEKAYNRFGPNLVKRLAAEHDAEQARAAQAPEPPPLELAPEGAPTPQGPRPDVRGEAPTEVPEWSTAAGVGAQKPGSQIPAIEPEGLLPAVGDDMPPARINPEPRGRVPNIPAVPGRPDMPDVMVAGGPGEVAGNLASGVTGAGRKGPLRETTGTAEAMQSPGAALAREQQGFAPKKPEPPSGGGGGGSAPPSGGLDPRLAKIAELRRQAPSAAVKKVLDAREAEIKKIIKRETDIAELEAAAQATDDVDLRQSLLAEANKLRGGKLPVGEVKEGQPDLPKPKTEKIPVGQVIEGQPELPAAKAERIPVGEATEITPEVVEAAPERLPVGEATEMPERLPVGEVVEDPIPVGEAMEFEPLPVGEVTEITPEVVEPARGPVVPEATNVDNTPTAPAGGGRSEGMEQTVAPPKPEDFTNSAQYHLAVREWRSKHGAKTPEPDARAKLVMDLDRKIENAERRLADRRKMRAGLTPPAIVAEAIANIEKELAGLRKQRTAAAQQENTRTAPQPAPTAPAGGGRSEGMEQTKITHAGMEIEEIPAQGGEPTRWQVTVPETGERVSTPSGLDAAKRIAENERKMIERSGTLAQRTKAAEETAAAEERARAAKREANAKLSVAERRANSVLDKPHDFGTAWGLGSGTRRDALDRAVEQGRAIIAKEVEVPGRQAADKKLVSDHDSYAFRIPGVVRENANVTAARERLKDPANYKKTEYRIYQGSEATGAFRTISKTEYDYAVKKAAAQQENARTEPQPAPTAPAGGGRSEGMEQTKGLAELNEADRRAAIDREIAELNEADRRAAIDRETAEHRPDAPEVAQPMAGRQVTVVAKTLNGYNTVRAKLYEVPGYKGPQLAVKEYKTSRGQGYRVYLPKSGAFIYDNNGVGSLADALDMAVLRVANAKRSLAERGAPPPKETPRAPQEVTQQAGVPAEPQGRTGGREATEAGAGDRVQRAAEGGGQAQEPDALSLTPKQYHEAKLRRMADENGVSMSEVREMYDTEAGRAENVQEWVGAVMAAAKAGKPISRATLDKLEEVRPRAVGQLMHDYPHAKLPEGYQVPDARKAEAEESAARRANRAAAETGAKKEGVTPARPAPKPTGKALSPTEVKAEFQRQIDAVPRFDDGGPETITLKAGGSTVKLQNTARRVAEYMKALDTVKGGKTPKPVSEKKARIVGTKVPAPADKRVVGWKATTRTKTWGSDLSRRAPLKTITDMIDDLDPQAAVDFAAAQGIDLEVALKDDRKRLDQVRNLKPTPETP